MQLMKKLTKEEETQRDQYNIIMNILTNKYTKVEKSELERLARLIMKNWIQI